MAVIVERGGRFLVRVRKEGFKAVAKTFPRRSDAAAWGKRVEADMAAGRWKTADESIPTLDDALGQYRAAVVSGMKGAETYAYALDDVAAQAFSLKPVNEVTAADVAGWRDDMAARGLVPGTVVRRLGLLSGFFSWAWKERGWLAGNPMEGVRKPKVNDARDRVLTAEEQRLLLVSASSGRNPWLADALVILLQTAMRRSELWSLTTGMVDHESRVARLSTSKNGEARDVPLSTTALQALRRLSDQAQAAGARARERQQADAPSPGAERLLPVADAPALSLAFRRAVARARDLYREECKTTGRTPRPDFLANVRLHDLRHTSVTAWASTGSLSVHELQLVSGHKTMAMLGRYVNLKASDLAAKLGTLAA